MPPKRCQGAFVLRPASAAAHTKRVPVERAAAVKLATMVGQDDRVTLARALAEDRWFEAQRSASATLRRWIQAEAAMTALFNAVEEPAWLVAPAPPSLSESESVSAGAVTTTSVNELLAEAQAWCRLIVPPGSGNDETAWQGAALVCSPAVATARAIVVPLDDPPAYAGNDYKDRFYRWYPPKRIAPAPLSQLQLRHIDIFQVAAAARAEWLDAVLAFSRSEEATACPAVLADVRAVALQVRRCLQALYTARDNPTARRRSFFRRSVDAQENAAHDSKYAAEASAVERRVLEIVDGLQSDAAYALAPIPLVDSRGISDLAFVGRDHLTYGEYRRAVASARKQRGLSLDAPLFEHHRALVWRGLLPPNDPISEDEDYTAQVDAVHGRRLRWSGADDNAVLLPRWAAAAVAQGLCSELPSAATKRKVTEGIEEHSYRHGSFPSCTPPIAHLRSELEAAATDRGTKEAPVVPLEAAAVIELERRVDWLDNDAGRDSSRDDGRWTDAIDAVHGDDALARDPRTACPTAFGIRRLEADEHLADVENQIDLLPFRLAIPFQRLVPVPFTEEAAADGGRDDDVITDAFLDRVTTAPVAVEAAAGEVCPEPSQMFELLGRMPLASVEHRRRCGSSAEEERLVEHVYDDGLHIFAAVDSGAWRGLRLHTSGWSGAGWRPPVAERLEPALQQLLDYAQRVGWDTCTESFRGNLSCVHVTFSR